MASFSLTGCGSEEKKYGLDAKNPVLITVWHYYNSTQKTAFDSLVDEFNRTVGKEKGIVVKAYSQGSPTSLEEAMRASAQKKVGAEELPNIFSGYVDLAYEIDEICGLANMDKYFTENELAAYLPNYIEEGRIGENGELKILPVAKSTEIMMVNKTAWDTFASVANVTLDELKTWEGVQHAAELYYQYTDQMTPEPNDGKAMFGRDAIANYMLLGSKQLGCDIISEEETISLDETVIRKLWDNYYVPYIKGYFVKKGRFVTDDMKTGDIIVMVASNTSVTFFPNEVVGEGNQLIPVESITLPEPYFKGTQPMAIQQGAGMAITQSDSAHEYASAVFLEWFTESKRNLKFAFITSYLPVTLEANDPKLWESMEKTGSLELTTNVKQCMTTASEQLMTLPVYVGKTIDNGVEVRRVLENAMAQKATADREKVVLALQEGKSAEEAWGTFLTDENFNQWFGDLKMELNRYVRE